MTTSPINRPNADDSESRRFQKAIIKTATNNANAIAGVHKQLKDFERQLIAGAKAQEDERHRAEQREISLTAFSTSDNEYFKRRLDTIDGKLDAQNKKLDQILQSQDGPQGLHTGQVDLMKLAVYREREEN